jgi:copper chaperone CopZ
MESSAVSTHNLKIDGMTGEACVNKVEGALKHVKGVAIDSVKVGSASIKSDAAACTAACTAIGNAGYKAHEAKSAVATEKPQTAQAAHVSPANATQGPTVSPTVAPVHAGAAAPVPHAKPAQVPAAAPAANNARPMK